jgi:hypothetical protein
LFDIAGFLGMLRIFMGCCRRLDIRIFLVGAELRLSSRDKESWSERWPMISHWTTSTPA